MASSKNSLSKISDNDVEREVNEINALLADLGDDDESWIAELNLNNTNNQSSVNTSKNGLLDASFDGFDATTGNTWLFPIGFEKRDYQLNISRNTLFNNTLVILPTGLGKTLIASVTIYNFFRWYPKSKIIFMAPTRPLVNQQISACYEVVGIPKEETAEMTGTTTKKDKRKELWHTKRVFFATPQVVCADMAEGILPTSLIKLLVFDEAHKAKGEYAYCKVINEALKVHNKFRVLALTATAGKSSDVIQIIQNLIISKIDYRSENSIDVRPYTHLKVIETVGIKLTFELQEIYDKVMEFVDPIIKELRQAGFVNAYSVSKGYLIMEQNRIRECRTISDSEKNSLMSLISAASSFYYSLEILERHSVHLFIKSLKDPSTGHYKYFVHKNYNLLNYIKELDQKFAEFSPFNINPSDAQAIKKVDFGHPKFDILKTKLQEYFNDDGAKAIIFCEYRDTTALIEMALLQMKPLIKSKCLIGQGGKITQKNQLQIMKEFRDGKINTLVCTCVAEEGLDIGAVDLVICFDIGSKNSTRFVQRIGRTARKRKGKVIVLATEGRELHMIKQLVATKDSINKSISRNKDIAKYFYNAPRLIPKQFNPQCIETKFAIARDELEENDDGNKKKKRGRKGKAVNSKENIANFFKPAPARKSNQKAAQELEENVENDDVIEIPETIDDVEKVDIEPCIIETHEINADEYTEMYRNQINQFIKDNQLEDNLFIKDLIEHRAKEEINSIKRMANILKVVPRNNNICDELNFDDLVNTLTLSSVKNKLTQSAFKNVDDDLYYESFSRYGKQFQAIKTSSPFVPVRSKKINDSIDQHVHFATPDFAQFKSHQQKISASTPLKGRSLESEMNDIFLSQVDCIPQPVENERIKFTNHNQKSQTHENQDKFPFLGINSISDIFEGCPTDIFDEASTHESTNIMNQRENVNFMKNTTQTIEEINEIENSIKDLENSLFGCSIDSRQKVNSIQEKNHEQDKEESLRAIESEIISYRPDKPINKDFDLNDSLNEEDFEVKHKEVFKKFNIDDIDDLFGDHDEIEKSFVHENAKNDDDSNDSSEKTQIYDVEEEMSRIERERNTRLMYDEIADLTDNRESVIDSQKSNIDDFKENSQSPVKSEILFPTLSNMLMANKSNTTFNSPSTSRGILQSQSNNLTQDPTITSVRRRPNGVKYDYSPGTSAQMSKISSQSINDENSVEEISDSCLTQARTTKRKIRTRKKGKTRNPFVFTQVDVEDDNEETSDDGEHNITTLGGFVVNETICDRLNRTTMQQKYLQSLRSPNAPINKNSVIRPLKPITLSQIYSQMPEDVEEEECGSEEDEFASFIVNTDDEDEENNEDSEFEIDELELAERRLKERRRMKRMNLSGGSAMQNKNKKRKIMRINDTSSEDEELKQLRKEVDM